MRTDIETLYGEIIKTELEHSEIPKVGDLNIDADPDIDTFPVSAILSKYFRSRGLYGVMRTPIVEVIVEVIISALKKKGYKLVKKG